MSKQTGQYFISLILLLYFLYPVFSEAAELSDTKVLPITPNSYRKDPTELKKAVRKVFSPSYTASNDTKSNSTVSKVKTTTSTPPILANTKSDSAQRASSSDSKTATKNTSVSDSQKNASSDRSNKPKMVAKSSIKVSQPEKAKEEKTTANTYKSKVVAQSSIKVSQPQKIKEEKNSNNNDKSKVAAKSSITISQPNKKLKEEKTSRKDKISEPILKVKLGGLHTKVAVMLPEGGQINNSKGKRIKVLKKGETFSWTSIIDKNAKKKKKIEYLNETLYIKPAKNIFSFNNTEYRGKLYLKLTDKGATAVNEIPIEDYLRGVVGREIGANSPDESLKAQSVIARTYAYANKGRHGSDGADVCNTTHCQVYFGKSAERESVDKAIKNTRGYILSYNSKPISALYHATCGGMTSNNEEVWGGAPEPFLRRVICNYCVDGTKYRWNQELDIGKLRVALAKEGVKLGEVYNVSLEAPANMDRVTYMVFQTNNGEQKIRGTTVRRIFDLPSTTFVLGNRNERSNLIASAKADKRVEPEIRPYKNNSSILITSFSHMQYPPKQLLVYTANGLRRATIPTEGWRCISYKPSKSIAVLQENEDNNNKGKNLDGKVPTVTNSRTSIAKKSLKPLTKINIFGRGFGHQVGMCQSGAVGMGKKGWNYRQILAHYYHDVAIKNLGY